MNANVDHTTGSLLAHNKEAGMMNGGLLKVNGNNANGTSTSTTTTTSTTTRGAEMSHEERQVAQAAARFGYGPLAQTSSSANNNNDNNNNGRRMPAFGGDFQPGIHNIPAKAAAAAHHKFANPAPLGLSAFALTTFVLSLCNFQTRGVLEPNIVVGLAFGYGGLVQVLAGMWEMAVGNTFGATAFSSYGGFWIAFAITLTPGGFAIISTIEAEQGPTAFYDSFAFFIFGWFIFTTLLLVATLRSTVAFFFLFSTLDISFLLLGIGYLHRDAKGGPNAPLLKTAGFFSLLSAFAAWYCALAGMLDDSNSFFLIPVMHFPWSVTGRENRLRKKERVSV